MALHLGTSTAGTSQFSLQDFEPSWGAKMNAAVREAWLESYGPAATDYARSLLADDGSPKLSAAEAEAVVKESGLKVPKLSAADGKYTRSQLDVLLERQRELTAIRDVRDRTPWGVGSVVRGAAMFGAGIVDPLNLATAFVPWTRAITALNGVRAATMAESFVTRTAARAALGGADAGISTALLEPAYFAVRQELGDDYGMLDSLANIAFGTAFGGGIHSGGGAALDLLRYIRTGRFTPSSPALPGNPAPPADFTPPGGLAKGGLTRIRLGDSYEPAVWSVIDADDLQATVEKADNQFRDRSRAAYQAEIQQRANNLDFNLLAESPVMDYGAPTLAADGRIIGGNGRALFISRAYEIGKGADYRAALEAKVAELGIEVETVRKMRRPVLVRVLQRDVDVRRAAMLSNEGGSTDMSPLEQAKVDAERLGDSVLEVGPDGDLNAPANRAAIRKWVEAQPENKRNSLVDDDGRLSQTGLQRLNAALMYKAYGDSPVLGRLIESMDQGSRNIALAIGRTAGVLAAARARIASGDLHPLDIADDLQMAVEKYNQLREQGMKIADYFAQLDAFGDGMTPEARLLLDFMGRNIGSPRRIADMITGFYDRLDEAGNPKQADMFGGVAAPDKTAMLQDAISGAEQGLDAAADVVANLAPETREAALRASVAQSVDGREVDVDAIVGMDESLGTATIEDVVQAASRNMEPENQPLADFAASEAVQQRVDSAPRWRGLADAEAAAAEADTVLSDVVAAGDQAFKYSRSIAALTEDEYIALINPDGRRIDPSDRPVVYAADIEGAMPETAALVGSAVLPDGRSLDVHLDAESGAIWGRIDGQEVGYVQLLDDGAVDLTVAQDFQGAGIGRELSYQFRSRNPMQLSGGLTEAGEAVARSVFRRLQEEGGFGDPDSPIYARGIPDAEAPAVIAESIARSFGKSTDALVAAGRIQIVATPADIPGGPHPGDVKAATAPDGTVYMVASNISETEARGLVLHEVGVHVGMEQMLGPDVFRSVLSQLDDAIVRGEDWAQAARAAVPADTRAGLVREEQLAYLVQNAPELPIVQRIIAAVRAWAYRTFEGLRDRMTLTEADFRAMAVSALHAAARGEARAGASATAPSWSRDVAQIGTRAFREWFGDSKVVDESGAPKIVYHGTPDARFISEDGTFKSERERYGMGRDTAAHWFAADPATAASYADERRAFDYQNAEPSVIPAYLKIENPMIVDAGGKKWREAQSRGKTGDVIAEARAAGHDGVIIRNVRDNYQTGVVGGDRPTDTYVVWNSTQIKSTDNVGTFDPTNPDIRYSRGETPDPSTVADEIRPYDERIARAKQFAPVLRAAADKLQNDAQAVEAMRAALPDITPQEINDLLDQLRRQVSGLRNVTRSVRDSVRAADVANDLQPEAMKAADELANNIEMAAVIEKRNAQLNIAARLRASSFLNQFRDSKLDFEGFRGLLVGTERRRVGGRLSVDAEQKQFRGEWLGGMIADLEKEGLMRQFASGEFDRDIYVAMYNLGREGDVSGLPAEAVSIAKIVSKYQEDARNTRNRFGAWIRDLSGYIVRQSHDMFKIRDAGEKAFKEFVLPRLDIERTLRDFEGSIDDFLTRVYDDFASGSHMKTPAGEDDLPVTGMGSSLAKRESQSRVLYFKDGNAAFEYNEKFGQGRLAESVLHGLEHAARSAGLLKVLGTNPEATVTRLFDEYADSLRGDPQRRASFLSHRKELQNLLAHVDGSANIPGNFMGARVGSFLRSWQTMAKLGGMLISSISDLTNYAAEIRFGQDRNLFSGLMDSIGAIVRGRASGERQAILNSLGVFHESTLGAVLNRFDNPDLMGGKTAALMQQYFKLTGINWWTESLRDGYVLSHSNYLASNAVHKWDSLPASLRDMLGLYNIDEGKWDVLRIAALTEADGRKYMTPEGLQTVPYAALENYIQSVGRTPSEAAVQNLRDDLAGALRAMMIDRMHHAVIEPNARVRAFMQRGTQPGTVSGEFLRFIGQFKSFPVSVIQMALGREIYGRGYDTLGDYLRRGKGDMLGLVTYMLMSTMLGYGAMSIKDMLRGKNPRPVDDPTTWAAAMIQGGGLGIYGDFLFGKFNRMGGTLTGSAVGPVGNLLDTAADLWTRIRSGDDFAASAFQAALQNTPFLNLFYLRTALDYLLLYQIQEALNPGYLRRMERRVERENGQTFFLPPSQVVR